MSSPSTDPGPEGRNPNNGTVRVTSYSTLAAFFCVGLVAGWVFHYLQRWRSGLDPTLSWPASSVILFLAALLAIAALRTHAARRAGVRLPAHRAVNLLALGKASARVGAAAFGAYAGFALGYLRGSVSVPASQLVLVAVTALAGLALGLAGLALERACEIKTPPDAKQ